MADDMGGAVAHLSPEELDEAERRALAAAVAEALADPEPGVPHEQERLVMLQELAELRKRIAALPPA